MTIASAISTHDHRTARQIGHRRQDEPHGIYARQLEDDIRRRPPVGNFNYRRSGRAHRVGEVLHVQDVDALRALDELAQFD
jgi:hypothetical protein